MIKRARIDTLLPVPKTMGLKNLEVGKNAKSIKEASGWLEVVANDDTIYRVPLSRVEWVIDGQEVRQEVSTEGAGGSEKKSPAKKRARPAGADVRASKKVRSKPKKASSSKLQSSSGEDVRPSVHASGSGDEDSKKLSPVRDDGKGRGKKDNLAGSS